MCSEAWHCLFTAVAEIIAFWTVSSCAQPDYCLCTVVFGAHLLIQDQLCFYVCSLTGITISDKAGVCSVNTDHLWSNNTAWRLSSWSEMLHQLQLGSNEVYYTRKRIFWAGWLWLHVSQPPVFQYSQSCRNTKAASSCSDHQCSRIQLHNSNLFRAYTGPQAVHVDHGFLADQSVAAAFCLWPATHAYVHVHIYMHNLQVVNIHICSRTMMIIYYHCLVLFACSLLKHRWYRVCPHAMDMSMVLADAAAQ